MKQIKSTDAQRSWFCVWNNPQKHLPGLSPEETVRKVITMWTEGKPKRSCAVNYEIGDQGTPHLHMVLEDPQKTRFSALQKLYPGIHIAPTRGNKKQAMDYIYKVGDFVEKGHTLVVAPVIQGEIKANVGSKSKLLDDIEEMIEQGMSPTEIMDLSIYYREKETLIRKAFYAKRMKETPTLREVRVRYHIGDTGTGKSYVYVQLCDEHGEDAVYYVTDHSENGAFDFYCGEPYIVIDELRYMKYEILLQIMQGYKAQVHCRYENAMALWKQVDITSILPPEKLYENIIPYDKRSDDGFEQFKRRIHTVVYHYKKENEFKIFELPGNEYTNYEDLKRRAMSDQNGFMPSYETPFDSPS